MDASPAGGRGGAAPALPCLKNNNCDSDYLGSEEHLRKLRLSVLKQGYALTLNVERFFDSVGVERVGFLTLTTPDHLSYWEKSGWDEASKRYHNFLRRVLPSIFGEGFKWVKVMEPTLKGRIHFHLLVDCGTDIRTGVDWEAFGNGDYRTAPKALRDAWAILRERAEAYGMGRCELLPIRTNVEACKRYVGKYLNKGLVQEWGVTWIDSSKKRPAHSRRISYSQGWRVARSSFAWVEKGREWRKAVAHVADVMGFTGPKDFVQQWGEKWAYHHSTSIMDIYRSHQRAINESESKRVESSGPEPILNGSGICGVPPLWGGIRAEGVAGGPELSQSQTLQRGADGSHQATGIDQRIYAESMGEKRFLRSVGSSENGGSVHNSAHRAIEPPRLGNNLRGVKLHPGTLAAIKEFGGTIEWVKHKPLRVSKWPD